MDIVKDLFSVLVKLLIKIALFIYGIYLFIVTKESLLTNLEQHDDAWIPDAMMLLMVCMFFVALIVGKPGKKRPTE